MTSDDITTFDAFEEFWNHGAARSRAYQNAIDQLRFEGKNDEEVSEELWSSLEGSISEGDVDYSKALCSTIRYFYENGEPDNDVSEEPEDNINSIIVQQKMSGVGLNLSVFLASGDIPRVTDVRFDIEEFRSMMQLTPCEPIIFNMACLRKECGGSVSLWIASPCSKSGYIVSAIDQDGKPSFSGPMIIMGRTGKSNTPRSLDEETVKTLVDSVCITLQLDSIDGMKYNAYVISGLELLSWDSEDVDLRNPELMFTPEDLRGYRLQLSCSTYPMKVIDQCLGNIDRSVNMVELGYELFEALVMAYGSKQEIIDDMDDYDEIINFYSLPVIEAFEDARNKVLILTSEQITEIKKIIESNTPFGI